MPIFPPRLGSSLQLSLHMSEKPERDIVHMSDMSQLCYFQYKSNADPWARPLCIDNAQITALPVQEDAVWHTSSRTKEARRADCVEIQDVEGQTCCGIAGYRHAPPVSS